VCPGEGGSGAFFSILSFLLEILGVALSAGGGGGAEGRRGSAVVCMQRGRGRGHDADAGCWRREAVGHGRADLGTCVAGRPRALRGRCGGLQSLLVALV
jgi:hypothetical protein